MWILIGLIDKAKDRYNNSGVKGKAAEYYIANKDVLKEKANSKYKNMSEKRRKRSKKRISKKYIQKHERKNKLKHYFFV